MAGNEPTGGYYSPCKPEDAMQDPLCIGRILNTLYEFQQYVSSCPICRTADKRIARKGPWWPAAHRLGREFPWYCALGRRGEPAQLDIKVTRVPAHATLANGWRWQAGDEKGWATYGGDVYGLGLYHVNFILPA